MIKFKIQTITMDNGENATSICELNDGFSHIIVDEDCWVIVNGNSWADHIFPEAMKALQQLPNKPSDYRPFTEYLNKEMAKDTG